MRDILRRMPSGRDTVPVVLVGDFNAPRTWTGRTSTWPVTKAAEDGRSARLLPRGPPRPAREPGHTWSPVHAEHEDGSGRPEPQDRIDFVLHRGLTVLDSRTFVSGTPAPLAGRRGNDWPSDHAAVITTFAVRGHTD